MPSMEFTYRGQNGDDDATETTIEMTHDANGSVEREALVAQIGETEHGLSSSNPDVTQETNTQATKETNANVKSGTRPQSSWDIQTLCIDIFLVILVGVLIYVLLFGT